ncbi:MAG: FmdB family zinc ribbon protein [Halorhodospira sp.]
MPIYEYECRSCGYRLEAIQSVADEPLSECPECQQSALKRLVSAAAFRLKGGGWYETDFKSGKRKNVAEGEGRSTSADGGTGGGSGEGSSSGGTSDSSQGKGSSGGGTGSSNSSAAATSKSAGAGG